MTRTTTLPMATTDEVDGDMHLAALQAVINRLASMRADAHDLEMKGRKLTAEAENAISNFTAIIDTMQHVRDYAMDQRARAASAEAEADKLRKHNDYLASLTTNGNPA